MRDVNQKRICMVVYTMPPFYSGAGAQALRLAKKLREKGVPISMLTAKHARIEGEVFIEGIKVYRLSVFGCRKIKPLIFALAASLFLLRNHRTYDIVHLHGAYWRIVPIILVTKFLKKKIIVKMTQLGTDDPMTIRRRKLGALLLKALSLANAIISISPGLSDSYRQSFLPLDKLVEIPNGINTNEFRPLSEAMRRELKSYLQLPADDQIVTFVGNISQRKGVDLLIEAWRNVIAKRPHLRLLLIGPLGDKYSGVSNSFAEDLFDRVRRYGLSDKVSFLGYRDNVKQYLQVSDLFVLPSRLEGLPNALLEAMACGVACVATDITPISDIITDGINGLTFPKDDVSKLSQVILALIDDLERAQKLGEEARKTILGKFSLDKVACRYVKLYESL